MRSVLVTGASSGVGKASALRMDAAGWRVFAGVRREEDGQKLLEAASGRLIPVMLDITDSGQIDAAAERIAGEVGGAGLDGLVNNAGITIPAPLEALPIEDFRRLLEINLVGQLAVTQAVLPQLRQATGRIVFVSSISGRRAAPLLGAYSASKSGLGAIADGFRQELRSQGISVSMIEPGAVETPIWGRGEEELETIIARSPVDVDGLYGKMIAGFRRLVERGASSRTSPEKVAGVIERALTSRRPRLRYVIGPDAHAQAVALRIFPDRLIDFGVARLLRS